MGTVTKKATNVTLSVDVIAAAKAYGINISQECDAHLRDVVKKEQERRWLAEHADYIERYNELVETEGLALEMYRTF